VNSGRHVYTDPALPVALARLPELAFNLWWTWQPAAMALFRDLDPVLWVTSNHNPVRMIAETPKERLVALGTDSDYLGRFHAVLKQLDAYMDPHAETWFGRVHPDDSRRIAYFCAEFGLHESLPIYSGGLGVLAGDHCKAASDLGVPLVAVGLWYQRGYFRQHIDPDGRQIAEPETVVPAELPVLPALSSGAELMIRVPMAGRSVAAQVWKAQVGRIPVYLLDPDVLENSESDRALCARLYGGDRETRLGQELLLGIGGVLALRALGIAPTLWHMNEGHAAFVGLERMRELIQAGRDFTQAWPEQAENTIFTTHTPVPAGNELFRDDLVVHFLPDLAGDLGLTTQGLLDLAKEEGAPSGTFALTPLALRLSHRANGVSALHGAVARRMWQKQFPGRSVEEVPITSVTNGIHTATWIGESLRVLLDHYLGSDWLERPDDPEVWTRLDRLPNRELWEAHLMLKTALGAVVLERGVGRRGGVGQLWDPQVLTIGFARRFARYKRATLLFHDLDRVTALLTDPERPVRVLFAGKAHPADEGGQALIQEIVQLSQRPAFIGKILFLEGYDLALAHAMTAGVDLWLNNPERPQEASGTSGQKAGLNGVPNCSIRDGWWDEGYRSDNGWALGGAVGNDDRDSAELYALLENAIIPAFYERDEHGLPARWLTIMRASMRTVGRQFSAHRMVKEYVEKLYHPA
jgi:glycogen phosphorylase